MRSLIRRLLGVAIFFGLIIGACPAWALTASKYFIQLGYSESEEITLSGAGNYSVSYCDLMPWVYTWNISGNRLTVTNVLSIPPSKCMFGTTIDMTDPNDPTYPLVRLYSVADAQHNVSPSWTSTDRVPVTFSGVQNRGSVLIPSPICPYPVQIMTVHFFLDRWDDSTPPRLIEVTNEGLIMTAVPPSGTIVVSDGVNTLAIGVGPKGQASDALLGPASCNFGQKAPIEVGGPVNVTTGNMWYQPASDGVVRGRDLDLDLRRFYNSQGRATSPFGLGWTFPYGVRWEWVAGSTLKVVDEEGRGHYFFRQGANLFRGVGNEQGTVTGNPVSSLVWQNENLSYQFDSRGNLTMIQSPSGEGVVLSRNPATGLVSQATLSSGRGFSFISTTKKWYGGLAVPINYTPLVTAVYQLDSQGNPLDFPLRSYEYSSTAGGQWLLSRVKDGSGNTLEEYLHEDPAKDSPGITQVRRYKTGGGYSVVESHSYDPSGRAVTYEKGGSNEKLTLNYSTPGQTTVTDSQNHQTVYRYQGPNQVTSIEGDLCVSCGGAAAAYSYDVAWNITAMEDRNHNRTERFFDSQGRLVNKIEAAQSYTLARFTTYEYLHPDLDVVTKEVTRSVLSPTGDKVVKYNYKDGSIWTSNLRSVTTSGYTWDAGSATVPFSLTTSYSYNGDGQVTAIDGPRTDINNDITTFTYYGNGDLQNIHSLAGTTTFAYYDTRGNPKLVTDPNGNTTDLTYDSEGRISRVTTGGQSTDYTYYFRAGSDLLYTITPPGNNTLTFGYDPAQRLTSVTDAAGNKIEYGYDSEGNRTSESVSDNGGLRQRVSYVWNSLNQLEKVIQANGGFSYFEYDDNGNRRLSESPEGRRTTYGFDALNRLIDANRDLGGLSETTAFGYDPADNLVSVTDGNHNTTAYTYDDGGRLLRVVSPDSGATRYFYDLAGNLTKKVDGRGWEALYTYDAANRLTSVTYPSDTSLNVTYIWDLAGVTNGKGRLGRVTDGTGNTQYAYDYAGRVTAETRTVMGMTLNTAYSYRSDGTVASMTYPSGRTVNYNRSITGAIQQATAAWSGNTDTLISAATPFPFGGYRSLTYGNGVVNNLGYDQDGRLAILTAGNFLSYAYSRLSGGDITGIHDLLHPTWSASFGYNDHTGRLISGLGSWGLETYDYDFAGNRILKSVDGQPTTYQHDPGTNRLDVASGLEAGQFEHDGMGNMTKSGEYDFEYDAAGRMKKAFHQASLVGEYRYNAAGQRVGKNGQRVYVYGLSGELIGEYQSDGTPVSEVVYADGMRVAEYRDIKTPPPPLPRGPQGYNISRDAGYATEDRTFVKAADTLYCRVWADTVDPGQVTVKEAKLQIGSNVYTWQLSYDSAAHEWKGSKVLSGVSLTPGNFWTFTATISDSLGHTYQPSTTVTVSTGAFIRIRGTGISNLTEVTANNCDTNGLVEVSIRGSGFSGGGAYYRAIFGDVTAGSCVKIGGSELRALVPARFFPGKVDVRVLQIIDGGETSEVMLPCSFTYRWPTSGANLLYYHNDHLGTPVILTNKQGTMVWRGEHRPFGEMDTFLQETDPDGNGIHLTTPFRFPGQYFDEETGLHYNYARYFEPKLGRYLQPDPIRIGFNLASNYPYVSNNPLNRQDPMGLSEIPAELAGEILPEIWNMVLHKTLGGLLGAAIATDYCKKGYVPRNYYIVVGDCISLAEKFHLPYGVQGDTASIVTACANECLEITNSKEFKKNCGICP